MTDQSDDDDIGKGADDLAMRLANLASPQPEYSEIGSKPGFDSGAIETCLRSRRP